MFTMDGTGASSSTSANDFNFLDWVGDYAELRGHQSETSAAVVEPILDHANITTWEGRYGQPGLSTRAVIGGTNISGNGFEVGAGFPGPSSSVSGADDSNLFARSYNTGIDMFMAQAQRYRHSQNPQFPAVSGYTNMVQPRPLAYPPGEQTAPFGAANWRFGQPNFEMSMNNSTTDETVGRPSKRLRHAITEPRGPSTKSYTSGPSALSRPEYSPPVFPNDLDFSNLDPDLLAEFPITMNAQFMSSQAHDSSAPSSSDEVNAFMVPLADPVAGPSRSHTTWNFPSYEIIPAASQSPIAAVLPPDPFSFPAAAYTAAVAGAFLLLAALPFQETHESRRLLQAYSNPLRAACSMRMVPGLFLKS
ncbi:uncharacterized protein LAESUDRAFT_145384 [Laetiporus sulphureus 93-53]|uniref:Uncharacterized protein n=1 Tax=Laetiporus sulphureus 93-53 TaxID=1314785 RepID=A0A165EAU6_9APHY|nr:uncharacterized protein LAESUDRAFT_145384 [Laetiporus sulphureus 93-53]KZT06617.1 hypothetical protein LAESUDRAFT_145384 [Laetiporus sulphureus 93-53]